MPQPVPLHIVRRWDTDARVGAWNEAQRAGARDPDAAALLVACLRADEDDAADDTDAADTDVAVADARVRRSHGDGWLSARLSARPFDPMRLLARVAKFYGFAHRDLMRMPWPTFLGYAREADIMNQEEQDAYDRMSGNGGNAGGNSRGGASTAPAGEPWRVESWR